MFARLFGMRVVSLRYFNVYGPRQATEGAYVLVIPHFLRLRDEGKPLTVYGDGSQTRGYTHVSDVVRANVLASGRRPAGGRERRAQHRAGGGDVGQRHSGDGRR